MKVLLLTLCIILQLMSSEARLIRLNKTKIIQVPQTEKPNPAIRMTRDAGGLTGLSKEESLSSEFIRSHRERMKYFLESKLKTMQPEKPKTRIARSSKEASATNEQPVPKPQTVLVKKPIQNFKEMDEEDFQSMVNKVRISTADSGDHEDEDFNVDDYEFDVNHDEFISRGKPIEPRNSRHQTISITSDAPQTTHLANTHAKITKPTRRARFAVRHDVKRKPELRAKQRHPEAKAKHKDVSVERSSKKPKNSKYSDNDYEESKESSKEGKSSSGLKFRSWDNTRYHRMTHRPLGPKILGILPLFPQLPHQADYAGILSYLPNDSMLDPTDGSHYLY